MACSTCQFGCYKEEVDDAVLSTRCKGKQELNGSKLLDRQSICVMCKIREGVTGGAGGGEDGRFCAECFRGSLFGKFRLAVTSNAMILPSDKVLVAFSGGPSSRAVLQFVHEMQQKAQKNFDARRDKSVPVFGVGVAFIDESSTYGFARDDMDRAIEQMNSVISELFPPKKELHVAPNDGIYSSNLKDGSDRLRELLNATKDSTGREDLILYFRMLSLQKIAVENGYTKLVLGTCTSGIARHVITATVKIYNVLMQGGKSLFCFHLEIVCYKTSVHSVSFTGQIKDSEHNCFPFLWHQCFSVIIHFTIAGGQPLPGVCNC